MADPPRPRKATAAPAGSDEKIEVMRDRESRGEHLYHPEDSKIIIAGYSKPGRYRSGILEIRVVKKTGKTLP